MRIGVNCFLLQPHIGGLKQHFLLLFDWLLENDQNTYIFFHVPENISELEKLASPRWRDHAVQVSGQEQIAEHFKDLDLYFCMFGAIWPRPAPIPSVVALPDIQEAFYPQFFTREDLFNRAWHFAGSTRAADRVITLSEFSRQTIVRHHNIPESKVKVAYLCADPVYFRASEVSAPLELPFEQYVIYPANRWLHKNHDVLLRAIQALKAKGVTFNAVFTGMDMPNGYPLMEKAREYGIAAQIHVPGYVTILQLAHLYRRAEMLVFPSLFEGFGLPAIEAMAAGCPALVARATSLPEICSDAAEYFTPDSHEELAGLMTSIRQHPERRNNLVVAGRRRAAFFTPRRMAEAHLGAFREAAAAFTRTHYLWQRIYQPWHAWRVRRGYS